MRTCSGWRRATREDVDFVDFAVAAAADFCCLRAAARVGFFEAEALLRAALSAAAFAKTLWRAVCGRILARGGDGGGGGGGEREEEEDGDDDDIMLVVVVLVMS